MAKNQATEATTNFQGASSLTMEPTNEIPRGTWMQVQSRRRPRKQEKNSDHKGNETRNGSHFSLLDPDENNLDDVVHQHADNNHTAGATNGKGPANVHL